MGRALAAWWGRIFGAVRTVAAAFLLALLIAVCAPGQTFSADEPDLKTIAQKLQQWRSSFVNVRVVYEHWGVKSVKNQAALRPSPDDSFTRVDWVWADVGAVRLETRVFRNGNPISREIEAADARTLRYFQALYADERERPGFVKQIFNMRMRSSQPVSRKVESPLAGLYSVTEAEWLGDRLEEGRGVLERYEDLDGVRCARLRLDEGAFVNSVWLDPEHDFLVRRIRAHPDKPEGAFVFDVAEFQRVGGI